MRPSSFRKPRFRFVRRPLRRLATAIRATAAHIAKPSDKPKMQRLRTAALLHECADQLPPSNGLNYMYVRRPSEATSKMAAIHRGHALPRFGCVWPRYPQGRTQLQLTLELNLVYEVLLFLFLKSGRKRTARLHLCGGKACIDRAGKVDANRRGSRGCNIDAI